MIFPFLIGKNIYLAPVSKKSIPAYLRWRNSPLLRDQLLASFPETEIDSMEFIERITSSDKLIVLDIYFAQNNAHIGNCMLSGINYIHRNAELGIMIGEREYQNRGLGTEAVRLMVEYGFHTLNLHKIYLRVFETNEMAKKVYEKVGFSVEGIMRDQFFINGRYIDAYLMSLVREDYTEIS